VDGIGVVSLLWNKNGEPNQAEHIPIDFRVYDRERDGKTKNQHCRNMLESASRRGFANMTILPVCPTG